MMYRVRRSWPDADSQIGAYEVLQNARIKAHDAGEGFSVFDESGNAVYIVSKEDWYRVRRTWAEAGSQIGAYWSLDTARQVADGSGYTVFDWDGNAIYQGCGVKTMQYKAKLLRKVGGHAKGSTVIVTRDTKKRWVIVSDGTIVGQKSYMDLKTQIYDASCKYSKETAEAWVNGMGISSKTEWLYWCSKWCQRVYVFHGKKGAWILKKTFKCGTGNINYGDGSDQGVNITSWKIHNKGNTVKENDVSSNSTFVGPRGKQHWNQHYSSRGGNSLHAGGTGKPSTHGCISMSTKNAQWCYQNLPLQTRVAVF